MGGKILLVDDEERMRKLIRDFLAKEGFQVDECSNGLEAVDKCRMDPSVSLVIMDVMMPVMDGWSAVAEIRKNSKIPRYLLPGCRHFLEENPPKARNPMWLLQDA